MPTFYYSKHYFKSLYSYANTKISYKYLPTFYIMTRVTVYVGTEPFTGFTHSKFYFIALICVYLHLNLDICNSYRWWVWGVMLFRNFEALNPLGNTSFVKYIFFSTSCTILVTIKLNVVLFNWPKSLRDTKMKKKGRKILRALEGEQKIY